VEGGISGIGGCKIGPARDGQAEKLGTRSRIGIFGRDVSAVPVSDLPAEGLGARRQVGDPLVVSRLGVRVSSSRWGLPVAGSGRQSAAGRK